MFIITMIWLWCHINNHMHFQVYMPQALKSCTVISLSKYLKIMEGGLITFGDATTGFPAK